MNDARSFANFLFNNNSICRKTMELSIKSKIYDFNLYAY